MITKLSASENMRFPSIQTNYSRLPHVHVIIYLIRERGASLDVRSTSPQALSWVSDLFTGDKWGPERSERPS